MKAASRGHFNVIATLMRPGMNAAPEARDKSGLTALDHLLESEHVGLLHKLLIELPTDVYVDFAGQSARGICNSFFYPEAFYAGKLSNWQPLPGRLEGQGENESAALLRARIENLLSMCDSVIKSNESQHDTRRALELRQRLLPELGSGEPAATVDPQP
jgi:hypothetical protein